MPVKRQSKNSNKQAKQQISGLITQKSAWNYGLQLGGFFKTCHIISKIQIFHIKTSQEYCGAQWYFQNHHLQKSKYSNFHGKSKKRLHSHLNIEVLQS